MLAWWWVLRPASFARHVAEPVRGLYRWHRVYRSRWREAMDGCGLIVRHDDTEYLPQVDAITSNGTVDTLRLRLAAGQAPQDVADAAEGLRHVYRALRCSVREDGPGWVLVRFFVRDPLTTPIPPAPLPPLPGAGVPAQRPTVDVVLAAVDDAPHDARRRHRRAVCRSVRQRRPRRAARPAAGAQRGRAGRGC